MEKSLHLSRIKVFPFKFVSLEILTLRINKIVGAVGIEPTLTPTPRVYVTTTPCPALSPRKAFALLGSQWGKPRFLPLGSAHPLAFSASGIRSTVTPFLEENKSTLLVAGVGFAPTTSRLWAWRGTTPLPRYAPATAHTHQLNH